MPPPHESHHLLAVVITDELSFTGLAVVAAALAAPLALGRTPRIALPAIVLEIRLQSRHTSRMDSCSVDTSKGDLQQRGPRMPPRPQKPSPTRLRFCTQAVPGR
jgi:hypothetical protein